MREDWDIEMSLRRLMSLRGFSGTSEPGISLVNKFIVFSVSQ